MTISRNKRSNDTANTTAMTGLKFAAIDVGSNGVRLLLARVFENGSAPFIKKESLIRMPIRIGADVFVGKPISDQITATIIETMSGFRHLIDAYAPIAHSAAATSAMREAVNGENVVRAIREQSGIELQIIDGTFEAEIIASNGSARFIKSDRPYLYIDIGGGSTELTLFVNGERSDSRSFKIGTVRLLKNKVNENAWNEMKKWLQGHKKNNGPITAVGSGGNINKLFRMSRVKEGKPVSYKELRTVAHLVSSFTFEERITLLNLRPDRADVIVPATEIMLSVMKWAGITKMLVPLVGLADGLIRRLYNEYQAQTA